MQKSYSPTSMIQTANCNDCGYDFIATILHSIDTRCCNTDETMDISSWLIITTIQFYTHRVRFVAFHPC